MRRDESGFTLIEILLSVLICSIVAGTLYRVLAVAVMAHERVGRSLHASIDVLSVFYVLERDLNNIVYDPSSPADGSFKGNAQEMTMFVNRDALRFVRYRVNQDGDLLRSEVPVSDFSSTVPVREEILLERVDLKDVRFSFGYIEPGDRTAILWKDHWHRAALPFAVRWSVELWSGPSRSRSFPMERTVVIPHGDWGR